MGFSLDLKKKGQVTLVLMLFSFAFPAIALTLGQTKSCNCTEICFLDAFFFHLKGILGTFRKLSYIFIKDFNKFIKGHLR